MAVQEINNVSFTLNPDYYLSYVKVALLNTITCTLPDLANLEGVVVRIKFDPTSGATGSITITPAAGQTIENASSKSMTFIGVNGGAMKLLAHKTNWIIVSGVV